MSFCSIVSGQYDCAVCSANRYLDCLVCSDFMEGCKDCYNIGACSKCAEGYYTDGDKCFLCHSKYENCEVCNRNECQKCKSDFAFDANLNCVSSPKPNCKTLYNGNCIQCVDGYYWKSYSCLSCSDITNCELCDNGSTCTQCLAGFFLQSTTSCVSCRSLNPFCLVCDSASECTQCDSTHYLTDLGTCASSGPAYCKNTKSNNLSNCIECLEGYNWDQNNKICKACSDIMQHCAECEEGNIEDFECLKCDVGYALDPNGVCIKSPLKNCEIGLDAFHCEECLDGSVGTCLSAGAPIANCKIANTESSYCVDCILGYSHTKEGLCECSAEYCTTCNTDDGSICDMCIDNYYGDCVACSTKISNCDTCEGGVCTKCSEGYYLFESQCNLCTEVDANCITYFINIIWWPLPLFLLSIRFFYLHMEFYDYASCSDSCGEYDSYSDNWRGFGGCHCWEEDVGRKSSWWSWRKKMRSIHREIREEETGDKLESDELDELLLWTAKQEGFELDGELMLAVELSQYQFT
ncbi:unnamed protein product [Blepharisma stoltei]|uniref:EGF-like domain-containing protein n=1 Tax=Blepharisma stoltei TaxID=1481888 RepID=A0AAU9JY47_9CILI|nr:unnamed protein product [Blepharisma stoltei]